MKNTNAGYLIKYKNSKGKKYITKIKYKNEKDAWQEARELSKTNFNVTVIWADTKIPTTTYAMLSKKNAKN